MTTPGWPRMHMERSRRGSVILLLGPILLSSCAAAPLLVPVAFEFARNLFQTGLQNYGSKHRDNLSNLVNRLSSPYMQGLPGQQPGGPPPIPGQQAFPGQPGTFDPSLSGFPAQSGVPPQSYPGQQAYPGHPGAQDPNNPYAAPAMVYPGSTTYPGTSVNPYGTAQGYPAQPGTNAYNSNNPYGAAAANPYGQPANPSVYNSPSPYGQQANPYGTGSMNPYGMQPPSGQNPYGASVSPYGAQNQNQVATQPYGTPDSYGTPQSPSGQSPYGSASTQYGTADPYAATQPSSAGAGFPAQQGYGGNNPYGAAGVAPGYGQMPSGPAPIQPGYQAQSGYGASSPYGTQQPPAPYGGYGVPAQAPYAAQPYSAAGIYPRSVGTEPVIVDVAMIRQKTSAKGKEVVLLNDGEVLKDGGGTKEAGDRFKIVVRANCECYVYIVTIDGSGWAEPIYPHTLPATPVRKDEEYAFPDGAHWFTLDQVKGVETFFVVVSPKRRSDLEDSMAQMAATKRPETAIVAKVEEPPIIPRGVGTIHPRGILRVPDDTGPALTITPLSYAAGQPGQDVTVTRWFKHE